MTNTKKQARFQKHQEIAAKFKSGMTLAEVGADYGVSRERIRQIVAGLGLEKTDGGSAIRCFLATRDKVDSAKAAAAITESLCFKRWGMSMEQYRAHVAEYGNTTTKSSPLSRYMMQRKNAQTRGIEWDFTFLTWWSVWIESGKWEQRGLGKDLYVMARHGDSGIYSVENVYICTQSQNAKDSYITSPAAIRFANCNTKKAGSGRGWTYNKRCPKNPYQVQFRHRSIGNFPTPESAREAYLNAVAAYK